MGTLSLRSRFAATKVHAIPEHENRPLENMYNVRLLILCIYVFWVGVSSGWNPCSALHVRRSASRLLASPNRNTDAATLGPRVARSELQSRDCQKFDFCFCAGCKLGLHSPLTPLES